MSDSVQAHRSPASQPHPAETLPSTTRQPALKRQVAEKTEGLSGDPE